MAHDQSLNHVLQELGVDSSHPGAVGRAVGSNTWKCIVIYPSAVQDRAPMHFIEQSSAKLLSG